MADQLFYGKLSNVTPVTAGSNNVIRFNGDYVSGSNTISNVTPVVGYADWEILVNGMGIISSGETQANTTVVSFDSASATITMSSASLATANTQVTRISPPVGTYYIASASFADVNSLLNVNSITGSEDATYDGSTPIYAVLAPAANNLGTLILGRYHKYTIQNVLYRNVPTSQISMYVTWEREWNTN
jgi:hypothetical protein